LLTKLYNFFAEIPWFISASLLLGGAVLWWTGNSRLDRQIKRIGLTAFLAAMVLILVSWLLVSDRERVMGLTKQFVKAIEARDWRQMEGLMHPKVMVVSISGQEAVGRTIRSGVEGIELKSVTITRLSTRPETDVFTVVLGVYSNARPEFSLATTWEFDWAYIDHRWQLVEIRGLDGWGVKASDLAGWLERLRGH